MSRARETVQNSHSLQDLFDYKALGATSVAHVRSQVLTSPAQGRLALKASEVLVVGRHSSLVSLK